MLEVLKNYSGLEAQEPFRLLHQQIYRLAQRKHLSDKGIRHSSRNVRTGMAIVSLSKAPQDEPLEKAVAIERVSKKFGTRDSVQALGEVTLDIGVGEFVAIVGQAAAEKADCQYGGRSAAADDGSHRSAEPPR